MFVWCLLQYNWFTIHSIFFLSIHEKQSCIINFEFLPADHLTKFFLNPVEGSRSAHTRIPTKHQSVMGWQWRQGLWKCYSYIQVSDVLGHKPIPIIKNVITFLILFLCDYYFLDLFITHDVNIFFSQLPPLLILKIYKSNYLHCSLSHHYFRK